MLGDRLVTAPRLDLLATGCASPLAVEHLSPASGLPAGTESLAPLLLAIAATPVFHSIFPSSNLLIKGS